MTSKAKRRINSTGRKRISRDGIDIRMLQSDPGAPLRASAKFDLAGHGFPSNAQISLEAYHRSSGMRFDCGTISHPAIPEVLVLDEVDQTGSVLFRLKVVDGDAGRGLILGSAEKIQPASEDENKDRRSLFPVIFRSLGEQVWKVEINSGDRPKLVINRDIPGIAHRLNNDAFLQGILFPAAFRIVMEALAATLNDDDGDDDDEQPAWQSDWIRFCQEGLGISDTPSSKDAEERQQWIEYATDRFCSEYGFVNAIRQMESRKAEDLEVA